MTEAFNSEPLRSVEAVAFGDLFLEDVRTYREDRIEAAGKRGCFPLWHRDTTQLAREFIAAGFEAVIVCLDPAKLDPSFAGRRFDFGDTRGGPRAAARRHRERPNLALRRLGDRGGDLLRVGS